MAVEGQTRFYVDDNLQITELVVTRTFTEWENTLQRMNRAPVNHIVQSSQQQPYNVPQLRPGVNGTVRKVPVGGGNTKGLDWTQPGGGMKANRDVIQRPPPARRNVQPQKPITFRSNKLDLDENKISFTSRNPGGKKKRTGMTWSD